MKRKGREGAYGKGRVELEQSWGEGETGLETHQFLDSAAQARAKLTAFFDEAMTAIVSYPSPGLSGGGG